MTTMIDTASRIAKMSALLLKSLVYAKSFISVLPINSVDALLYYADDENQQEQHYGQR